MKRILAILLAFSCLASATEQAVHWSDLKGLINGKEVVIHLQDGNLVKGRAAAVDADSLIVGTTTGPRSVTRASLRDIRVAKSAGHKWRLAGTAIGAGAGAAVSVPLLRYAHNEGSSTFDGAAAGVIVGFAVLGYVIGWSSDRSGKLIRILPD